MPLLPTYTHTHRWPHACPQCPQPKTTLEHADAHTCLRCVDMYVCVSACACVYVCVTYLHPLAQLFTVAKDLHRGLCVGVVCGLEAKLGETQTCEELNTHTHTHAHRRTDTQKGTYRLVELKPHLRRSTYSTQYKLHCIM